MTRVVIVGELYNADLSIGGGPIIPPGQPQPPLGMWGPNDPRPSNPIAGMGPGGNFPMPPPLVIWGPGDPRPTNPIAGPGRPPGWGMGGDPGWGIDVGGGGQPPYPSQGPGLPTNPIAEPPWGWGNPAPPITLPPEVPPLPGKVDWKYGWTAQTGWVVIGVPAEGTLVPTPSAA